jgi:hypothetical protein
LKCETIEKETVMEFMDPEFNIMQQFIRRQAMAAEENSRALEKFESARADWLLNAPILLAIKPKEPLPPKPVPALAEKVSRVGDTIVISWGPELVGDPHFDLPKSPDPPPPGKVVFGPIWGNLRGVGLGDTAFEGQTEVDAMTGKKWIKRIRDNVGGTKTSFYEVVPT